jgi:hypothetical protein
MLADAAAWVFHSPRRLAVTAVTILAVVLLGGSALFGSGIGGGIGGGSQGTSSRPTEPAPAAQVPDAGPYVRAAVAFVTQWSHLQSGESAGQWQAKLMPLTTTELGEALRTTDPAELPGVGPRGEPVVRYVAQSSAMIAVPLADGSSVLVSVVNGGQGLLVSDVQPNVGD